MIRTLRGRRAHAVTLSSVDGGARHGRWFSRSLLVALVAASSLLAFPSSGMAGELESKTLFAEGRALREKGKCADAIVVFRKAFETFPDGLGALRNVAECEQEIGMLASARRDWRDLRLAVLKSTSPKYVDWDADAAAAVDALGSRVARVTLHLGGPKPETLRILMNGQPFDPRLVDVELEQDDGPLAVEVFFGGSAPIKRSLDVKEGERQTITIDLPLVPHSDVPHPDKTHGVEPTAPPSTTGRSMRIGGGISLGVAGLGVIGTVASLVVRQGALSSIDKVCKSHKACPSSLDGDVSRGKTASALVNVFAVTAGVGAGLGLVLLVAAPDDSPAKPASKHAAFSGAELSVGVDGGLGGAGLSVVGRF